jgi:hypothetical protein
MKKMGVFGNPKAAVVMGKENGQRVSVFIGAIRRDSTTEK